MLTKSGGRATSTFHRKLWNERNESRAQYSIWQDFFLEWIVIKFWYRNFLSPSPLLCPKNEYRISSHSCRGNYSFFEFIKVWKFHIVSSLSFPLCNENLNSFLTRWGNYSKRGNYSREETIWGNTVLEEIYWIFKITLFPKMTHPN